MSSKCDLTIQKKKFLELNFQNVLNQSNYSIYEVCIFCHIKLNYKSLICPECDTCSICFSTNCKCFRCKKCQGTFITCSCKKSYQKPIIFSKRKI